jgi:flavin reductase (DIM6/NTAB) family NADH-FMN oxidoreductase RutF
MQHITIDTVKTWERFYRANFINCLTGFKAVSLIASVNEKGQPNLGVFSSVVHLGSDPALIGFINRPLAAAPHTIDNIKATGVYTINHIHPAFAAQAHQCSAKYPVEANEFVEVGLTEMYLPNMVVPFVKESNVKYALSLVEIVPITHNNTFLVIGKVTDIILANSLIKDDGFLALEEAESLASLGVDAYYTTQIHARYGYAKPDKPIEFLK